MNINKAIIGVFALLVLASGAYLVFNNNDSETAEVSTSPSTSTGNSPSNNSVPLPTADNASGYVDYSEQALTDAKGTERIVFFHANWCGTCNFFEGEIENQGVPEGVTILKVNYDTEDELKDRYGVTVQSTFVLLDANGDVKQSWPFASGLNGIQDLYDSVLG